MELIPVINHLIPTREALFLFGKQTNANGCLRSPLKCEKLPGNGFKCCAICIIVAVSANKGWNGERKADEREQLFTHWDSLQFHKCLSLNIL